MISWYPLHIHHGSLHCVQGPAKAGAIRTNDKGTATAAVFNTVANFISLPLINTLEAGHEPREQLNPKVIS